MVTAKEWKYKDGSIGIKFIWKILYFMKFFFNFNGKFENKIAVYFKWFNR